MLGSIVTRSPACQLSASAMNELDLACNLMEQRAASGRSAKAVVSIIITCKLYHSKPFNPFPLQPILRRLRDKARLILTQLSQGAIDKASPQSNSNSSGRDDTNDDDELAIFAGRTRFISSGTRSRSPTGSPQGVGAGVVRSGSSSRRRGSRSVPRHNTSRRGSEPFRFGDVPMSESDIFRQAHPSLLEYMRGINGYVPPPAIMQSLMAARARDPSPIRPVTAIKSDVLPQPGFAWVDPGSVTNVTTSSSPLSPTIGGPVFSQQFAGESRVEQQQHLLDLVQEVPLGQNGVYGGLTNTSGVMAQAVGTCGYPGELNGDGTWQQLMVQLGVMEGQN